MKKIFTLAAAVLASFSLWAATETVPKFSDNWTGTSISFTNNEGANGSSDQKKDGDAEKVTYVKFRTNKNGNTITLNVTDGYKVTGLYLRGYTNDGSASVSLNSVKYDDADAITTNLEFPLSGAGTTATYENNTDVARNAIVLQMSNSGKQLMAVLRVTYSLDCNAPATPLSITSDAPETLYAGTVVNLSIDGGNDATPALLLDGEAFEGTTWTAVAGTHTFSVIQAEYEGYCAQEDELELTVLAADAVESVTIDGPATAYVGEAVTFTATAENASDYAWTVNGVDANTNAAEFTFTPAASGEYSIVCSARNKFNATEEWIASEAKVLTASNVSGELLKVTVTGGKTGTVTGIFGGTADINVGTGEKSESDFEDQHGYKLNGNGYYVGVHSLEHALAEGDTAIVYITTASANLQLFSDKGTTKIGELIGGVQQGANKVILNSNAAGAKAIYLYRADIDGGGSSMNPYVAYISVVRPKAVDHVNVALVGVAIDGEALPNDFVSHLINQGSFTIQTSYVNAPVVAFVKHSDIYYEGETEPVSTNDSIKVTATEVEGQWQAQATIGENTYTITLAKAASFTVHYMDGTNELGTENVAVNETVAEYAQYQSKNLATFVGWYQDADLTIEANLEAPIAAETYLYAKFENKYAESINIEKAVMENGKNYGIIAQLGTLGYASNITGSLDSLSVKDDGMRNYAYLGLKVKQNGALLNFRLAAGTTVTIKFGEIKKTPNVSINGGEYAEMVITDKVYTHTAEADELISIKMMDGNAVVFQQIMIGEELQAPELFAINCVEVANGTVAAPFKMGIPGEEVELTFTPAAGYIVMSCTVNGNEIHQSAPGAAITFEMPAEDVTITTTFSLPTAIDNAEAAVKAEKVIRDGQVLILRDGKIFNALGAEVK